MKIVAITDSDTALAFRLAGIETLTPGGDENALSLVEQAADMPDTGIVLVTERLARAAGERFEDMMRQRHLPLFIEIPDINSEMGTRVSAVSKIAAMLKG